MDLPSLPLSVRQRIFSYLDLKAQSRLFCVSPAWEGMLSEEIYAETTPVWLYVIFRKNRKSGHDKPRVNISFDGPIFWGKRVIYVYCCSCHYAEKHEGPLLGLCKRIAHRVDRLCLVESPVSYPFITDNFFNFVTDHFSQLEFIYLRELDMESLNFATVQKMALHPKLKKVIVHMCRKVDVMQDFSPLPQLLVVKGEIQGLKCFIGDIYWEAEDDDSASASPEPPHTLPNGTPHTAPTDDDAHSTTQQHNNTHNTHLEHNGVAQASGSSHAG